MTMEPLLPDTMYYSVTVNPNNPYEILYIERYLQSYPEYYLYKYNFCTNLRELIAKIPIYKNHHVSWSVKGDIFIVRGTEIKKMNNDGSNLITLFTKNSSPYPDKIFCNPNGSLFLLTFDDSPNLPINKVYTEDGDTVATLPNQANFLGWYDNSHVLTNFNDKVMKVNVHTGDQEVFLTGTYFSYDYKTHRFLKYHDSSGYTNWLICDESGGIINSTPHHYGKGVWYVPQFVSNNKIIAYLSTKEFYPDKHTPACDLQSRERIAIMNEDGTGVRLVNFPE